MTSQNVERVGAVWQDHYLEGACLDGSHRRPGVEWEYRTTHIPGSMRISMIEEALEELDPNDKIILYDTGPGCPASRMALRTLKARGYGRVRRYAGGLEEWAHAGYPLTGKGTV